MSLEKASISWTYQEIARMIKTGKIDLMHIVQRGLAWSKSHKSALIESSIIGYPIPPIFSKRDRNHDNVYSIMDGKQRLNAIKEYMNNEFSLSSMPHVTYFDEDANQDVTIDISGKKFKDLPESLQNYLKTCTVDVIYFDNLTKEEEKELFKRLNAGKPLSAKSKLLASCNNIEDIMEIGNHPLFSDMLSEKARSNKNQVGLVMKIWSMLNLDIDDVSFDSKSFNKMIETIEITDDQKEDIIEILDLILEIRKELVGRTKKGRISFAARKFYTETHLISLIPYLKKALDEGYGVIDIANWVLNFYDVKNTASISGMYNNACVSGSAQHVNIAIRNSELKESFEEFFADNETGSGNEFEDIIDGIMDDVLHPDD